MSGLGHELPVVAAALGAIRHEHAHVGILPPRIHRRPVAAPLAHEHNPSVPQGDAYEEGRAPWSQQSVIIALAEEVLRLRGEEAE